MPKPGHSKNSERKKKPRNCFEFGIFAYQLHTSCNRIACEEKKAFLKMAYIHVLYTCAWNGNEHFYKLLETGAYSGFRKGGCGREAPEKIFRTQVRNCFAPTLFAPTPLFVFLPLDLIGSVVRMKRCKKDNLLGTSPLRMGAKIQGGCETKGGCKAPKRPTLNTPMIIMFTTNISD